MAFPIPLSSTGRGQISAPDWLNRRNVTGAILLGLGSIILAAATGKTLLVFAIAGGVPLIAGLILLFVEPRTLVYFGVGVMWFDGTGFGQVKAGRLVAVLVAVVTILRMLTSRWRPPAMQLRAWLAPGLFFTWAIVSAFWSTNMVSGWLFGMTQVYLGFAFFLLMLFFTETPKQLTIAFTSWIYIGIPIALLSDLAYFGFEQRGYGFTGGANNYAIYIVGLLPVAFVLIRESTSTLNRWGLVVATLIYLSALIASGSREGLIGGGLVTLYCAVFQPGLSRKRRVTSSSIGVVAVIGGVFIAAALNPDRFSLAGFFGDAGAGRLDIWNVATQTFMKHVGVGVGVGTFRTQVLDLLSKLGGGSLAVTKDVNFKNSGVIEAHNMYLTLLLDLGIVGLLLWVGMYATIFKNLWDLRKTAWSSWSWAFTGVLMSLVVTSNFGSTYNQKFQWLIFGFAGSMYYRRRTTGRETRNRSHLGLPPRVVALQPSGPGSDAAPMDLRLRYPFRWVLLACAVAGAVIGSTLTMVLGSPFYIATDRVLVVRLDAPDPSHGIEVSDGRMQTVLALATSDPYLVELKALARSDRTIKELRDMTDVTRPGFSGLIELSLKTRDETEATRVGSVMIDALDNVVDQARNGTITVLSTNGRDPTPDQPSSYRGPIYERVSHQASIQVDSPRVIWNALLGFLLGLMAAVFGALVLHGRWRLSSKEDLDEILDIPFLATLPRPRLGRVKDATPYLDHAATLLDSACADGARVVAVTGVRTPTLQSRVAVGIAAGLAQSGERPVIVIDLDLTSRALSRQLGLRRRSGFTDALDPHVDLASLLCRVAPRRVPRSMRSIVRASSDRLRVLPVGSRRQGAISDEALTELVSRLSLRHVVVLNLPNVPGPVPMQMLLGGVDAALLTIVDGWTATDDARVTIEALEAMVPRRVGFVLVEN